MIFSFLLVSSITWHMYYLCKAKIILDCNLKANKQTNKYVFEPKGATAWETQIYLATLVMFHRDKVEATLYSTSCHPGSVRFVLWKWNIQIVQLCLDGTSLQSVGRRTNLGFPCSDRLRHSKQAGKTAGSRVQSEVLSGIQSMGEAPVSKWPLCSYIYKIWALTWPWGVYLTR